MDSKKERYKKSLAESGKKRQVYSGNLQLLRPLVRKMHPDQ